MNTQSDTLGYLEAIKMEQLFANMPRQFSERVGNIDSQMSRLVAYASAYHVRLRAKRVHLP